LKKIFLDPEASLEVLNLNENKKTKHNPGRKSFLTSLGILSAVGFYPVQIFGINTKKEITDSLSVLKAKPYLQVSEKGKMTIRWITNMPCYSWVEFEENADNLHERAKATNAGLVEANNTVHSITIHGLKPGGKYYYRICSKVIETFEPYNVVFGETYTSEVSSFETDKVSKDKVSFLVFNDIHDHPESISHLLQYKTPGAKDFILMNGDILGHTDDEGQIIRNLLEPLEGVSSHTPIVFSRGNHETRGKFARQLHQYFNHKEQKFYFSFTVGQVYCIVLDSGEDKPDTDQEYFGLVDFDSYRLEQAEWLKKESAKKEFKKSKYKVVFSHIPLFYSGGGHGTLHCREVWADILNKAKIDLMICGHTHVSGIYPKVNGLHNFPIAIGGGPKDDTWTLIEINADEHSLTLKIIGDKGELKSELKI